ncbi:S1/P1 nuclease [Aliidiomarina haloalkalitolerans]|uniref:S1/P1 Nuclease n=1 Tax=Aliidiomarina haloalkalitolerans TaxID=859059 RepID=A0A432VZF8_9GAMM|nr:S1/P1 nuclease [Aliidiomarina haloalkalitolerans]RUO22046.1 hypothetical protein CWE06_04235 [Aliidiomarina haloalkalitolerans]
MRKVISGLIIAALLVLPMRAFTWGFQGHEYIGALAWEYLTPEGKVWVEERLALVNEPSLSKVTTWADRVRGSEEGFALGPLHFANIDPESDEFDMQRDCPNRRCVVGALLDDLAVMADANQSKQAQAEALRTFTHWITDMHQPLHMGYARDRGGNDIRITFFGTEQNLHRLWDTVMIRGMDKLLSPAEQAAANPLPAIGIQADWEASVVDWANHSFALAREFAYAELEPGEAIGESYFEQARPVIEQQLVLSAQRMAMIINAIAAD